MTQDRPPPRARDLVLAFALALLTIFALAVIPAAACGLGARVFDATRGEP